jgi:hypothetical protein
MDNVVDNIIIFLDICKRTNLKKVQFLEAIKKYQQTIANELKML